MTRTPTPGESRAAELQQAAEEVDAARRVVTRAAARENAAALDWLHARAAFLEAPTPDNHAREKRDHRAHLVALDALNDARARLVHRERLAARLHRP